MPSATLTWTQIYDNIIFIFILFNKDFSIQYFVENQ